MRTIWHSLAWKEWHEHKWKLVAITAVLCGVAALILVVAGSHDKIALMTPFVTLGIIPLAVFVGLGAAANERSRNTLPFLQSLPVPMWRAALMKLACGTATLLASITLTLGFICVWLMISQSLRFDPSIAVREAVKDSFTGYWFFDGLLLSGSAAISFITWSAATGVNRKDEVSAGAVALTAIVGWWLVIALTSSAVYRSIQRQPPDWFFALLVPTAPAGILPLFEPQLQRLLPLGMGIAVTTHLALATWYVRRFGRIEKLEVRSHQTAVRDIVHPGWLSAPRRSALTAIAWKQYRESAPLALAGIAGCVSITGITVLAEAYMGGRWRTEFVGEVYPKMAVVFGMFVALVAGIGVCFNDMQPKINSFWRSRPIQPDGWFWSKFATGLFIVLTSTYIPIAVLVALDLADFNSWNFPEAFAIPVAQMALFAAAVMTTCLVRHAVYAAILSLSVVYLGTLVGLGLWFLAGLLHLVPLNSDRWWEPSEAQIAFGMALSFVTSTIIAWLATRYDWGRKSRY